jgi:hypothetical protein
MIIQHTHILAGVIVLFLMVCYLYFSQRKAEGNETFEEDYNPAVVPKPGTWFEEIKFTCSKYPPLMRLPERQEDCYDSTFTFTDDVSRVVQSEKRHYPSCVQMTINTPYCYSLPDGSYYPDYVQNFYNGA